MKLEVLPEDCIAHILSFTSPRDSCRSAVVSPEFRAASESDLLWENFLPPDYKEIISSSMSRPLEFASKKELFMRLCTPLLIDGGKMTFSLDKPTSKKCYVLSARELSISWASHPLYWCWKPLLQSSTGPLHCCRFAEVAELVMVCWLEIEGKISTRTLSPNTTYGAYLVVEFADRAYGLDTVPSEVAVEVGNHQSHREIYLHHPGRKSKKCSSNKEEEERIPRQREDGWWEIELGEFYSGDDNNKEVRMSLREVKSEHLRGGLIVEGMEVRPKHSKFES